MPNDVVQYSIGVVTVANVASVAPVPLLVSEGQAFRVRRIEYRIVDLPNTDRVVLMGLSRGADEGVLGGSDEFEDSTRYMAHWGLGFEATGAAGLVAVELSRAFDVWDFDYRLVMRPTFHVLTITSAARVVVVVSGEFVGATENQRNAIIAIQGGAK